MKLNGWVRLWIVATVIGVPLAAEINFQNTQKFWDDVNLRNAKTCVDAELNQPDHPDAVKCDHNRGGDETVFQREDTTPAQYWSESFGIFFLLDLAVTGLLIGAFFVGRWVIRGFKQDLR